jgi:SulP family sulfate permease
VRSGARSPVAGMLHAVFLLLFMLLLAPLISYVPLATLAAVLVVVAWNMSEIDRFKYLMRAPAGDRLILILTFALTVMIDLTVAISVGVVLAAMLFMHRMAEAVAIRSAKPIIEHDEDDYQRTHDEYTRRLHLPKGVEVFELRGPLFFGVANRLNDSLDRIGPMPKAFILILRDVPMIDATGASALQEFLSRCRRHNTTVFLAEMTRPVKSLLRSMHVLTEGVRSVESFDEAVAVIERETA